jgi:hypothetical protein
MDLSRDNEQAAVSLGDKGDRLPQELLDECQKHTCRVKRVRNNSEIADSIASKYGVARCWDTLFGDRDSNGISKPASSGAHCQAVLGVCLLDDGEDAFIELQSWGPNMPKGPRKLRYAGGEIELPVGMYAVRARHYVQAQKSKWWEAHALSVRHGQEFR